MSHGVKRVRQSAAALEAQRLKESNKVRDYLALQDNVMTKKKAKDWTPESFELTTQLLRSNPELYTIWNYRRDILTNGLFPSKTPEEIHAVLSSELQLTFAALKQHPKVYWIWNHRRWCLQNTPDGPGTEDTGDPTTDRYAWKRANWARELAVVDKMLDADARNFHAWDYRRYIVASAPERRSEVAELAYTTRKIESNFSNFSAWHQRSKLLTSLWAKGELTGPEVKDKEYDLIKHAIYSDPNDQSAWLYHRWLIGSGDDVDVLEREIQVIEELLEVEPDSKWCIDCLVHYKGILRPHRPEDAERLRQECLTGLKTLARVDPQRKARYDDMAASLNM